jgi:hypothetical protein
VTPGGSRGGDGPATPGRPSHGRNRLLAGVLLLVVVGLIPWTGYLAVSLPGQFRARNWAVAWVGFDAALVAVLAYTAWTAWWRRQVLAPTAVVVATMLLCDAWFDVTTSFGTRDETVALLTAVVCNLPVALFFLVIARRILLRTAGEVAALEGRPGRPRRVRDVPLLLAARWGDTRAEGARPVTSADGGGGAAPDAGGSGPKAPDR